MQLSGTDNICPGETGLYRCSTRDLSRQSWSVNGVVAQSPNTDSIGDTITIVPRVVGYLVERAGEMNELGNRTTVLEYTPDADPTSGVLTLRCGGGGVPCQLVVQLIGII